MRQLPIIPCVAIAVAVSALCGLVEVAVAGQLSPRPLAIALLVGAGGGALLGALILPLSSPLPSRLASQLTSRLPSRQLRAWLGRSLLLLPAPLVYAGELVWAAGRAVQLLALHLPLLGILVSLAFGAAAAAGLLFLHRRRPLRMLSSPLRLALAALVVFVLGVVTGLWLVTLALALVVQVLACAALVALYAVLISGWRARLIAPLSALMALAAVSYLPNVYVELQRVLASLALAAGFLAALAWLRPSSPAPSSPALATPDPPAPSRPRLASRRLVAAAITAALGSAGLWAAHLLVAESPGAWKGTSTRGGVASAWMRLARDLTDLDGDGYGVIFGQTDCAPLDAAVGPGTREIPQNSVDDNCALGDARDTIADWQRQADAQHSAPPPWSGDVVVVLVDSLRADELAARDLPALAALRADGVVFERAYATSTFTAGSMPGIFAGRLPFSLRYNWLGPFKGCPVDVHAGLASWLGARGFRTALVGVPVVDALGAPWECWEPYSLGHGFDVREPAEYFASPDQVSAQAIAVWRKLAHEREAAEARRQRRFMYVHYMSVHNVTGVEAYRDEVRRFDRALGQLRAALGPEVLFVLLSDHGQAFSEHGGFGHAQSLYEEVVRIPLIVAGPPLRPGRVDRVVSSRQLAPTLLAMVAPDAVPSAKGPYLCLDARQGPCRDMPAPLELWLPAAHLRGLVVGRQKIIRDLTHGDVLGYDLERDPGELRPLVPPPPALLQRLREWEEYGFSARTDADVWPYQP